MPLHIRPFLWITSANMSIQYACIGEMGIYLRQDVRKHMTRKLILNSCHYCCYFVIVIITSDSCNSVTIKIKIIMIIIVVIVTVMIMINITFVRPQNLPSTKAGLVSSQVLHLLSKLQNWIWPKTGQYKTCLVSNTKIEASIRVTKLKPYIIFHILFI